MNLVNLFRLRNLQSGLRFIRSNRLAICGGKQDRSAARRHL